MKWLLPLLTPKDEGFTATPFHWLKFRIQVKNGFPKGESQVREALMDGALAARGPQDAVRELCPFPHTAAARPGKQIPEALLPGSSSAPLTQPGWKGWQRTVSTPLGEPALLHISRQLSRCGENAQGARSLRVRLRPGLHRPPASRPCFSHPDLIPDLHFISVSFLLSNHKHHLHRPQFQQMAELSRLRADLFPALSTSLLLPSDFML